MTSKRWIKQITKRVASRVKPKKIILFGSHAWGRPKKYSDIDLLVIMDKPSGKTKRYEMIDKAIGEHIMPLDILVRNSREIDDRLAIGDSFMCDIMNKGRVLYES
ncbi:nucleotidyltransferase domain-containing protein [Elusimicrobiota bacterium]